MTLDHVKCCVPERETQFTIVQSSKKNQYYGFSQNQSLQKKKHISKQNDKRR